MYDFNDKENGNILVGFENDILELKQAGKFSTARNYQKTLNSLCRFLKETENPFDLFGENFIEKYNKWLLGKKMSRNSISFYMRVFRAVCNKRFSHKGMSVSFLFQNVYTGIDKTCKRAVNEKVIGDMLRLNLSHSEALALARDVFIFSYATRGMAFC